MRNVFAGSVLGLSSALVLPACVTPSKSLGAGETSDTGDDPTLETSDETLGEPACAPNPAFTCTVPFEPSPGECSSDPTSLFDENCCMRLACDSHADCDDGLVCAPATSPFSCSDVVEEGETRCLCGAPPNGAVRSICVPPEAVPQNWCSAHFSEEACNTAEQTEVGGDALQFCRWIETQRLRIEPITETCELQGPESRCITFDVNPEQGCGPIPCTLGPLLMSTAIANATSESSFEVFGLNDVFCGEGSPVGNWIPADDPLLGPCAMSCSFDNPCGIPLVDYVELRGESSKDAPVDDCGTLTLDDPLAAWQAAHDCALDHATMGNGFRLVADGQGIDSVVKVAYLGVQGFAYAVSRFSADSGGIDPGSLFEQPGDGLEAVDACVVAVGELCLGVTAPGETVQLCPS